MKTEILEKSKTYRVFNDIALKNEIVIFGSTFAANFPFYELSQKYYLNNAIYNRSIPELTLPDAENILGDCVLAVKPSKIFIALGEADTADSVNIYKNIILKIKQALPTSSVYALSVPCNEDFNTSLKALCQNTNTEYININYNLPYDSIFKQLSCFFRKGPITDCDAFCISS